MTKQEISRRMKWYEERNLTLVKRLDEVRNMKMHDLDGYRHQIERIRQINREIRTTRNQYGELYSAYMNCLKEELVTA